MSKPEATTAEILVHLVQPGVESRDFHLLEGSTVADLLRASGIASGQPILIDGIPIEEGVPLLEGATVTIASSSREIGTDGFWGPPITAFQDEQLCREYWEALEAVRRDLVSEEDSSE